MTSHSAGRGGVGGGARRVRSNLINFKKVKHCAENQISEDLNFKYFPGKDVPGPLRGDCLEWPVSRTSWTSLKYYILLSSGQSQRMKTTQYTSQRRIQSKCTKLTRSAGKPTPISHIGGHRGTSFLSQSRSVIQSNLDYPDIDYPDFFSGPVFFMNINKL